MSTVVNFGSRLSAYESDAIGSPVRVPVRTAAAAGLVV